MPRITLTSHDGFQFGAWREAPREARRGGLVICHAVWGVTPHLKALAATFAEEGYEVLIPDLLARYDPDGSFPERDIDRDLYPARRRRRRPPAGAGRVTATCRRWWISSARTGGSI